MYDGFNQKNEDEQDDGAHHVTLEETKIFNRIFGKRYPPLCDYAYKIVNDEEVAKDIVSDVFSNVWERREKFKTVKELVPYLYVCVRNACFSYNKSKQRERLTRIYFLNIETSENQPVDPVPENINAVFIEIERLPPQQKQVINLHLRGLKTAEIAERLNISATTVKRHRLIAVNTLQSKLSAGSDKRSKLLMFLSGLLFLIIIIKSLNVF